MMKKHLSVKVLSLVLAMLILATLVPMSVFAKKTEVQESGFMSGYLIDTYEQLKNYAKNAQSDCLYVLNKDIVQSDNLNDIEIEIPAYSHFILDLNGYSISRTTSGNDAALFRIRNGGYMMIMDSSESTGYCSFTEGYGTYHKSVFCNEGGELEIVNGYYEIFSDYNQGDCSVIRATSGVTNIYDGTFDSSTAWGGDTISVGHDAYLYDTPHVNIFDGDFYGKYQSIDASSYGNYLGYAAEYPDGALHPSVYVLGGNFYVCNGGKDGSQASFAYCNNGWGRVIVAEGTVLAKCLNSSDQRFLNGASKKLIAQTIDDYTGGYYEVTAPPMIMSEGIDYKSRLVGLCNKAMVNSYSYQVYKDFQEMFDEILEEIDTIYIDETQAEAPRIELVNRTLNHKYVRWYMCDESDYNGADTRWTYLGDFDDVSTWQFSERPENGGSYIILCVVTDTDSNFYEDTIRVSFEPLDTTEIVTAVEVTDVDTPVEGATPDYEFTTEESFYINGVYWTDITDFNNKVTLKATDTFKGGHTYEVKISISANEGYKFRMDEYDWLDMSAVVGGRVSEILMPGSPVSAEIRVVYKVDRIPVEIGILGDANEDTEVNIKDATLIQKHIARLETLSETGFVLADADEDTDVNIKDATAIQKFIAGMDTGYSIGEMVIK